MTFDPWRDAFLDVIRETSLAQRLKEASLAGVLGVWTSCLTEAVALSCTRLGWRPSAKGYPSQCLPQAGSEYLSIDVMAFPSVSDDVYWPLPVAVFELENSPRDDRVAYSLWKVLCIRAPLRVVFAFRPDEEKGRQLVLTIGTAVIGGMTPQQRIGIAGDTVLIVGNRGDGGTFPWGYFKFWRLDGNLGRFERI